MNASTLITSLQHLIQEHGDLPMTIVAGPYEYSVSDAFHASPGPLPVLKNIQKQHPPERFVLEAKTDVPVN